MPADRQLETSVLPDPLMTDDGDSLGQALLLMRLFWMLDHKFQIASKNMEARIGLTEPQRVVLSLATRTPGISIGEVARLQHWHSATVTGIAQRLEKRGVLTRKSDPTDRRRKGLFATAKGKRMIPADANTIEQAVANALRLLGPETVTLAGQLLTAVSRELEEAFA